MRLVLYQYGDYAEAFDRLSSGGPELYYAQRYSVDAIGEVARSGVDVTVVTFAADLPERTMANGVRTLGVELYREGRRARHLKVLRELSRLDPTHLIVFTPQPVVLAWGLLRRIRVLPMFADSFHSESLVVRLKNRLLVSLLNHPSVDIVANHNLAASEGLVQLGVRPEKVVPFDWPAFDEPGRRAPKRLGSGPEFSMIYVGALMETKGVDDLLHAVKILHERDPSVRWRLSVVGGPDTSRYVSMVAELGITDHVTFLGRIPHDEVVERMNRHDVVVVPSRHEYPEGLPMTLYEGICSRSPLVVSDHPMFRRKIRDGETALVFEAQNPRSLARRIQELHRDPELYERLSLQAVRSAEGFFCPLKYHDLTRRWLDGGEANLSYLRGFSIATGRYDRG